MSVVALSRWRSTKLPNGDLLFEPVMPRIQDAILDCVVYIYDDVPHAQAGVAIGGSGFLISVPLEKNPEKAVPYVVTNSHVIRRAGDTPVVRLNTKDDGIAIHPYRADDWTHHPHGDDLAVAPIALTGAHRFQLLNLERFCITPDFLADQKIGPGDEVYMVGRFINHEGRQRNTPSVRFGAIAQMNIEPIKSDLTGFMQETFLIEGRSIPGYSGAPVFLYLDKSKPRPGESGVSLGEWHTGLLGIDWCHLNQEWPVLDKNESEAADDDGYTPGYHVVANTGMMGVIPAWKLWDILNETKFIEQRTREDERLTKLKAKLRADSPVTSDEAS